MVALLERGPILAQADRLPASDVPVFAGLAGGMAGLADALGATALAVRTDATVRELRRTPDGFEARLGRRRSSCPPTRVVLATPAAPTARLLADLAPTAAASWRRSSTPRWPW